MAKAKLKQEPKEWLVYVDFRGSGHVLAKGATADDAIAAVRRGEYTDFEATETFDLDPDMAQLNV